MNQSRAMEEAYAWTAADALAWAKGLKSWPRRRWRLEGSRAGNSRLLRETQAINMQQLYGGERIELIPAAGDGEAKKNRFQVAAEDMPKCPHCKESKGKPCRRPDGGQRMPHHKREKLESKKKAKRNPHAK